MNNLTVNANSSTLCKNKMVTDEYILKYQTATSNAVESILNMGLAVKEVYYKSKNGELDSNDLQYFCETVGLDPKSSTFRKYKCIGEKSHIFKQYLDKMPQSFSVLYEIATLDADTFDRMYVNGSTSPTITLEQMKKLAKKTGVVPARNKISVHNPNFLNWRTLQKVSEEMNRFEIHIYSTVPKEKRVEVTEALFHLQQSGLIRFTVPDVEDYIQEDPVEMVLAA